MIMKKEQRGRGRRAKERAERGERGERGNGDLGRGEGEERKCGFLLVTARCSGDRGEGVDGNNRKAKQ